MVYTLCLYLSGGPGDALYVGRSRFGPPNMSLRDLKLLDVGWQL